MLLTVLHCPMHKHLRAWRLHKNMTLEQVGNIMGKKHMTISRWERGLLKLKATDLAALAELYGATPTQLIAPPDASGLVQVLDRAQTIISGMEPETLEQWLAIGERLRKPA